MLIAHEIALDPNKARKKPRRIHARIRNIRNDALHKLTSSLTRRFDTIVVEDYNGKGMMKNHKLARSISHRGFFKFRRIVNPVEKKALAFAQGRSETSLREAGSQRKATCG
ncbi:transposase [Desulfobotulus sp. H1]|uniref:Transposase n=1 Tax=Desulfobotulus pelophilus TaxID=2823377 RepID=A0ABT3NAF6_9BACT|nr:transposase [Desulfobotulus pelophilus]MCW7754450.1 transposase [Desulfobotulus pelophilus]